MRASRLNATLTATDMFGETRMAAWRASPSISVRWAALKPVVPTTARAPTRGTRRRGSGVGPGPGGPAAAPATTMSGMATRVPGRLLHEAVRLEHRAQPLAVGLAHPAHRQPELRLEHPRPRHRLLDRDRIRLEEGGAGHREEPVVELARPLPIAVERGVHQLGGLPRQEVRDDRDDAVAADGHEREGDVVVAREHREVGAARGGPLAHLVERARRLLPAGDVLDVAREALERR